MTHGQDTALRPNRPTSTGLSGYLKITGVRDFRILIGDSQLKEGYEALLQHMVVTGGVLQDYSLPKPDGTSEQFTPVKDWRSLVRSAMTEQEVVCFRAAAGNQPTLAVLACSTDESLSRVQNLTKRSSHPINWIRLRLLVFAQCHNVADNAWSALWVLSRV